MKLGSSGSNHFQKAISWQQPPAQEPVGFFSYSGNCYRRWRLHCGRSSWPGTLWRPLTRDRVGGVEYRLCSKDTYLPSYREDHLPQGLDVLLRLEQGRVGEGKAWHEGSGVGCPVALGGMLSLDSCA